MKRYTKLFVTKASSIDEENKTIRFRISDNKPDRYNEIVEQKTWNFKDFLNNPIVLWRHDSWEPENVLGQVIDIEVSKDGSETYATVKFDTDINPKAEMVWKQLSRGTLRCVSVGFDCHNVTWEEEDGEEQPVVLKDNDLLEISIVPIPANPRAVALAYKDGSIKRKDAEYLMETMRREADYIERQIKGKQEKNKVTEEQAKELLEAVKGLTEKVEAQASQINELTEAHKAGEEARAAAEKEAEEKAEADRKAAEEAKKAEEEEEEAKRKAEEDAKKGDGIDLDDLDEDAELTPEMQAQIDAELEAQANQDEDKE